MNEDAEQQIRKDLEGIAKAHTFEHDEPRMVLNDEDLETVRVLLKSKRTNPKRFIRRVSRRDRERAEYERKLKTRGWAWQPGGTLVTAGWYAAKKEAESRQRRRKIGKFLGIIK